MKRFISYSEGLATYKAASAFRTSHQAFIQIVSRRILVAVPLFILLEPVIGSGWNLQIRVDSVDKRTDQLVFPRGCQNITAS